MKFNLIKLSHIRCRFCCYLIQIVICQMEWMIRSIFSSFMIKSSNRGNAVGGKTVDDIFNIVPLKNHTSVQIFIRIWFDMGFWCLISRSSCFNWIIIQNNISFRMVWSLIIMSAQQIYYQMTHSHRICPHFIGISPTTNWLSQKYCIKKKMKQLDKETVRKGQNMKFYWTFLEQRHFRILLCISTGNWFNIWWAHKLQYDFR